MKSKDQKRWPTQEARQAPVLSSVRGIVAQLVVL